MEQERVRLIGGPLDGWWLPHSVGQAIKVGTRIVLRAELFTATVRRSGHYVVRASGSDEATAEWEKPK